MGDGAKGRVVQRDGPRKTTLEKKPDSRPSQHGR